MSLLQIMLDNEIDDKSCQGFCCQLIIFVRRIKVQSRDKIFDLRHLFNGQSELQMINSLHKIIVERRGKEGTDFFEVIHINQDVSMQKIASFRLNEAVAIVWGYQKRITGAN